MLPSIISRYIAGRFLFTILTIFLCCFLLVLLIDFVELIRRGGNKEQADTLSLFLMSLYRVPELTERILPFATLFGSIAAFLNLSRRLELVIVRAAGMSAWQFLTPALFVAAALGIFAFAVYNPASAFLKDKSLEIDARIFGASFSSSGQTASQGWVRQKGEDGDSILKALTSYDNGRKLGGVTVFSYDQLGNFVERIDGKAAELEEGYWRLSDVLVTSAKSAPRHFETYLVSTHLTPQEASETIANPESVPFWQLPHIIDQAARSGLPAYKYRLQYQTLLARPLLLAAMVLIAATVSLKVFRFGNVGKMILSGVLAGFVLYVVTELAKDLGNTGLVNPILSAWLPAIVASLLGFSILLYQEDG
ncbi:lipopolysaccharide export system permease protein [Cohaesibacter sp. ES.047]|uniref:LPS export ABC transporter permease LptG n=1 Tax=Cohaesibacter sp. ES.047 TaxID=1798205 RepID=UPI000BB8D74F|nr:LPS export ABC transporter permease LptG [Cohaesibacter sp. ES.047]SNY93828.1 lipopolysaccharide export system permease protein [Cohaesibacter sp. ES.047]